MTRQQALEAQEFAEGDCQGLLIKLHILAGRGNSITEITEKLLYARGRVEFWKAVAAGLDETPYYESLEMRVA